MTTSTNKRARKTSSPRIVNPRAFIVGIPTAGVQVNQSSALTFSAVYRAVSIISATLGVVPVNLFRSTESRGRMGKELVTNHPAGLLIARSPNPEQTPFKFKEFGGRCLTLWGNWVCEIERDRLGRPVALYPLPPERVYYERNESGQLEYVYRGDTASVRLSAGDVLHVPLLGDEVVGISPISAARESIGFGLAAELFGAGFFGNGSTPGGVLEHPDTLSDEARQRLINQVESRHKGPKKAGSVMVLEEGLKWSSIGIPAKDAQFLETRTFQVQEIARWFGVPPHMLAENSRATFDNIAHQATEFLQHTMLPYFRRIEEELDRKLLGEETDLFFRFQVPALMRADPETQAKVFEVYHRTGIASINDLRESLDMNPIEGGDEHFIPANMMPLTKALKEDEPPPEDENVPEPPSDDEPAVDDEDSANERSIRAAFMAIFTEAAERIVNTELREFTRIQRKGKDIEPRKALSEFFHVHKAYVQRTFGTIWDNWAMVRGVSADSEKAASRYINDVRTLLLKACEDNRLESMVTIWSNGRAATVAEQYLAAAD